MLIELFTKNNQDVMPKNIVSIVLLLTALFISLRRKRLSSSVEQISMDILIEVFTKIIKK
jgi:hypothetical protein